MEDIYFLDESRQIIGLFGQNMKNEGKFPIFNNVLYFEPDTIDRVGKISLAM